MGLLTTLKDIFVKTEVTEESFEYESIDSFLERQGDGAAALEIYNTLREVVSDSVGAESAYKVILSLYQKGDAVSAEEQIYAFSDSKTPHSYWLGKAFILLGNIYAEKGDDFQARATYQSIIDGYMPSDDGVVAEAKQRLDALKK